jgi:hypothetical protein
LGTLAVVFNPTTEIMEPIAAAVAGPAIPGTILATNADGFLDSSLLPPNANTGSISAVQRPVTAQTNIVAGDGAIWADASEGGFSVILPDATTVPGISYLIKKVDASNNAVTIFPTNSQTIDGLSSLPLTTQFQFIRVESTGALWYISDAEVLAPNASEPNLDLGVNDVPYAANIIVDLSQGEIVRIHLDGPVVSSSFLNPTGNEITVLLQQGGSGNNSFTWPTNFQNAGPVVAGDPSTAIGTVCSQNFTYLSATGTFVAVSDQMVMPTTPGNGIPRVSEIPYSTQILMDMSVADILKIALTGNVTSSLAVNPRNRQRVVVVLSPGAGGPWSFAWPSNFVNAGDVALAAPGGLFVQSFVYVSTAAAFFADRAPLVLSPVEVLAAAPPTGTEQLQTSVANASQVFIPLSTPVASSAFNGAVNGQKIIVLLQETGTGGYPFTWPTNVLGAGDMSGTVSGTLPAGLIATQTFVYLSDVNAFVACSDMLSAS